MNSLRQLNTGQRLAVFEDDPDFVETFRLIIPEFGHELIHVARSLPEALGYIASIRLVQPRPIDAIVTDRNLGSGLNGADGEKIAEEVTAKLPGVILVFFAGERRHANDSLESFVKPDIPGVLTRLHDLRAS